MSKFEMKQGKVRLPDSFQRGRRGFTLIELMIVILVIAILVGIAIPVYLSIQAKADTQGHPR